MSGTEPSSHREHAVAQFNRCWDLVDSEHRTADDDTEMFLAAAASRLHWAHIGGREEIATGDWQVSHVASLLGFADVARHFAERNLAIAVAEGWTGWRLASAHEGLARALAVSGDADGHRRNVADAKAALADESDAESAQVVADQLATIPDPAG